MKKKIAIIALSVFMFAAKSDCIAQWSYCAGTGYGIRSIAVSGTYLYASSQIGPLVFSTDNGKNWQANPKIGITSNNGRALAVSGTDVYFATEDSIFRSTDHGSHWIPASNGLVNLGINTMLASGTDLFAAGDGGIFRSSDSGTSWKKLFDDLVGFQALARIGTILFAGNDNGVFRSDDNGANWQSAGSLSGSYFFALQANGTELLAGTSSRFYRSDDSGAFWLEEMNGLTTTGVFSIAVSGTNLFAGTGDGVYLSSDSGANWKSIGLKDSGSNYGVIHALETNGTSVFASPTAGIYSRALSDFEPKSVSLNNPPEQSVSNIPNPFSQSTSIKFSSDKASFTQVSIHNLLGSEVTRLFSGELDGGEHSFTWDASGMPPGMYVCIISANGRTEELPMMLVK